MARFSDAETFNNVMTGVWDTDGGGRSLVRRQTLREQIIGLRDIADAIETDNAQNGKTCLTGDDVAVILVELQRIGAVIARVNVTRVKQSHSTDKRGRI